MTDVVDIEEGRTRGPRIAVCIPTHDQVSAYTMYDLSGMLMQTGATAVADGTIDAIGLYMVPGTYVHRAREQLAEAALKADADYILWVDADMRFPRDALMRLLAHNKDVVGINYSKRGLPAEFVASKHIDWEKDEESEKLVTASDSTGLEEVDAMGMGLVLMRTHVFNQIADERPWFWYEMKDYGHVGEDVYFCKLLQDAGVDLWVDQDLSKDCTHIGSFEYLTAHAEDAMDEPEMVEA